MPRVTREQIKDIEWSASAPYGQCNETVPQCPVCLGTHPDHGKVEDYHVGHTEECWIVAAMNTPDPYEQHARQIAAAVAPFQVGGHLYAWAQARARLTLGDDIALGLIRWVVHVAEGRA